MCGGNKDLKAKYGAWALVTGASAGIGKEIALILAERGLNIVLVARNQQRLDEAAEEIRKHSVEARTLSVDLLQPNASQQIIEGVKDLEIAVLVLDAGMELHGPFLDAELQGHLNMVQLHCTLTLELSHHFGKQMVARKRGGILLVSTMLAFTGAPLFANYAATKSLMLVLAEGLHYELRPHGVDVSVLTPGATKTQMLDQALGGASKLPFFMQVQTPRAVAVEAVNKLGKRPIIVPGRRNRAALTMMLKFTPRGVAVRMGKRINSGILAKRSSSSVPAK